MVVAEDSEDVLDIGVCGGDMSLSDVKREEVEGVVVPSRNVSFNLTVAREATRQRMAGSSSARGDCLWCYAEACCGPRP